VNQGPRWGGFMKKNWGSKILCKTGTPSNTHTGTSTHFLGKLIFFSKFFLGNPLSFFWVDVIIQRQSIGSIGFTFEPMVCRWKNFYAKVSKFE
jgi:hypothetical protein